MPTRNELLTAALKAIIAGANTSAFVKIPATFIAELAALSKEKLNGLDSTPSDKFEELLMQSELSTANAALAAVDAEQIKALVAELNRLSTDKLDALTKLTQTQYDAVMGELHAIHGDTKEIKAGVNELLKRGREAKPDIISILESRTINRIKAEINSKKYIPDIFIEIDEIKDKARLFCNPTLFIHKIVDELFSLDFFWINRLLKKIGLPEIFVDASAKSEINENCSDLYKIIAIIEAELSRITSIFSCLQDRKYLENNVDKSKHYILKEIYIGNSSHDFIHYTIANIKKKIKIALANVLILTSKAGQGKTNLICNLADGFLLKRGIPCFYCTGKELSMAESQSDIASFIIQSIYCNDTESFRDFLHKVNEHVKEKNTYLIILIDGINEHRNIGAFSLALEQFIEQCLPYSNIKILLTCRSEYFDTRFTNLMQSSFADRSVIESEIFNEMGDISRNRLLNGYLRYFKIKCPMSHRVEASLKKDPLLLRMFCEAYGNHLASKPISVPRLLSINRNQIVRKYLEKKLDALSQKNITKRGFLVGNKHPYQSIIYLIIEWMIDNRRFNNVPIDVFVDNNFEILSELLGEDIIIRQDLIRGNLSSSEVYNFTYDFVRDFLVSDYLINKVLPKNRNDFLTIVKEISTSQNSVAEGLQEALFFASRHNEKVESTISKLEWYEDTLVHFIFDLNDDEIRDSELELIKERCLNNNPYAKYIVCSLIPKYDVNLYKKLNITTLFDIFDSMDDYFYQSLLKSTFESHSSRYPEAYYPIDNLVKQIRCVIFSDKEGWIPDYSQLARLLLYLWLTPNMNYDMPAQITFKKFSELRPQIARTLCREHIHNNRKGFNEYDYGYLFGEK